MTNGMDPRKMGPAERLDEVGMLLSLAMMRMWLKRRVRAGGAALPEREISSEYNLDSGAESRPLVAAGKP